MSRQTNQQLIRPIKKTFLMEEDCKLNHNLKNHKNYLQNDCEIQNRNARLWAEKYRPTRVGFGPIGWFQNKNPKNRSSNFSDFFAIFRIFLLKSRIWIR